MKDPRYTLGAYDYRLPEDRIARFPLRERDQSKLLVSIGGMIRHEGFVNLPQLLPEKSLLVFNETKVIPARLEFRKSSGATIEIFLLNPVLPSPDPAIVMNSREITSWHCLIRNIKKWKEGVRLERKIRIDRVWILLDAELADREKNIVRFSWHPEHVTFGEVIGHTGKVPLPPYLKREPEPADRDRYQTVYSKKDGAVAAPTAGLHFTPSVLRNLTEKGIKSDFLTLHVSAGTFQPIRQTDVRDHPMHKEQIGFSKENIHNLIGHDGPVIAVGTTSMRTLESLYWYGVKLIRKESIREGIEPAYPYDIPVSGLPSRKRALGALLDHMEKKGLDEMYGNTRIFIFPGYNFRVCDGLITNFHMPRSTLLLLVSAFIGDQWKEVYRQALSKDYRFLSYGDSSLLIP